MCHEWIILLSTPTPPFCLPSIMAPSVWIYAAVRLGDDEAHLLFEAEEVSSKVASHCWHVPGLGGKR